MIDAGSHYTEYIGSNKCFWKNIYYVTHSLYILEEKKHYVNSDQL